MLEILLAIFVIELGVYIQHTIARDIKHDKMNDLQIQQNALDRELHNKAMMAQIDAQNKSAKAMTELSEAGKEAFREDKK